MDRMVEVGDKKEIWEGILSGTTGARVGGHGGATAESRGSGANEAQHKKEVIRLLRIR